MRTKDIKNKRKNDYFQPELKTNRGNGSIKRGREGRTGETPYRESKRKRDEGM